MVSPPFRHTHQGRNGKLILWLALVWGGVVLATALFDLTPWIAGLVLVFTLPGLWEVITNPTSTLELDQSTLSWSGPRETASILLAGLKEVRLDTRLDFSVRVTLIRRDDTKFRLPPDTLPHHTVLERELTARGITVTRHHFALMS